MTENGKWVAPRPDEFERIESWILRVVKSLEDYVNRTMADDAIAAAPQLVARLCDCDCGTKCPQGKTGSASRCTIMVRP